MNFIKAVEKALERAYKEYNHLDYLNNPNKPQKWLKLIDWYQKRYCNPDSPERNKLGRVA